MSEDPLSWMCLGLMVLLIQECVLRCAQLVAAFVKCVTRRTIPVGILIKQIWSRAAQVYRFEVSLYSSNRVASRQLLLLWPCRSMASLGLGFAPSLFICDPAVLWLPWFFGFASRLELEFRIPSVPSVRCYATPNLWGISFCSTGTNIPICIIILNISTLDVSRLLTLL